MIHGGGSALGVGTDFAVLVASTVGLVPIAARMYARAVMQQRHDGPTRVSLGAS